MKNSKYQQKLGATVFCTKKIKEATKGIGQMYIKGAIKYCFLFGSLFASNKLAEAAMDVGAYLTGMV